AGRAHAWGRLLVRPAAPGGPGSGPGLEPVGLGSERDGVVYAPPGYRADRPAPLVVMLHGAGGSARRGLPRLQSLADAHGLLLLAVDSRERTWEAIAERFEPDTAFIDAALARVFARYAVDPARVAVEGFSDGASYALGLGLANGDLFTHAVAFSPGSVPLLERHGSPRVFVAHGTADEILPIDQCSRRIVPELRRRKYAVEYVEFDGPHTVPADIAEQAVRWFLS
ncbi:MAG TPA: PHB depolymerase family esterase, partial [Gemmatimonadales bacterium]|nr:PHB depolymerase family esterase [Gemmatimonadales bacterium]